MFACPLHLIVHLNNQGGHDNILSSNNLFKDKILTFFIGVNSGEIIIKISLLIVTVHSCLVQPAVVQAAGVERLLQLWNH